MSPKDPGKNLGYHWRRAAGVYDDPNRPKDQAPGNASTTTENLKGLASPQSTETK